MMKNYLGQARVQGKPMFLPFFGFKKLSLWDFSEKLHNAYDYLLRGRSIEGRQSGYFSTNQGKLVENGVHAR